MVLHPSDEDLPLGTPVLVDGQGLPLRVRLESTSPGEARLAEATLAEIHVPRPKGRPKQKPERVIADRAYDSDPLRERLEKRGIELIPPYRSNNKQRRYEDGCKLRRYKRRWIIERTDAWFGQFRRLLVRHEQLLAAYRGFVLYRLLLDYPAQVFVKRALENKVNSRQELVSAIKRIGSRDGLFVVIGVLHLQFNVGTRQDMQSRAVGVPRVMT